MKYSIIEEIYHGNRGQGDDVKESKRYRKLNRECAEIIEGLKGTFNERQREDFEKLVEKQIEVETEASLMYYKEGLKVGLLLLSECLGD